MHSIKVDTRSLHTLNAMTDEQLTRFGYDPISVRVAWLDDCGDLFSVPDEVIEDDAELYREQQLANVF